MIHYVLNFISLLYMHAYTFPHLFVDRVRIFSVRFSSSLHKMRSDTDIPSILKVE